MNKSLRNPFKIILDKQPLNNSRPVGRSNCAIVSATPTDVIQQSTNTLMARRSSSFVPWVDLLLEHTFQGSSVCTSCLTLVPLLLQSAIRCVYAARRWSAWSFCSLLKSVRNLEDCLMVSLFAQSAGRVDAYEEKVENTQKLFGRRRHAWRAFGGLLGNCTVEAG